MADLIASIFATHHSNWTDVQALLNILLTADERQLVINKANEEAQLIHQENPNETPNTASAIPLTEPDWNPNAGSLAFPEHYGMCTLEGLMKGVTQQKSLNVIQALQQKSDENPSEF